MPAPRDVNWLHTATLVGLAAIGGTLTAFHVGASYLLRRRRPDRSDPPSNYGMAYEEVVFASRDRVGLYGWWIPAKRPGGALGTIILCHGQEGSMDSDTLHMVPLYQAGFNVFMFDFRAHGRSQGSHVTMGMYEKEDLFGALDYLAAERGIERVGVLGFSMGATVALLTAALSDRIAVVVTDGSFVRFKRTFQRFLTTRGVPRGLARFLVGGILASGALRMEGRLDQTEACLWTAHIGTRPILFIHGAEDPYITTPEVYEMASLAAGPTEVWVVDGVGHRGAYKANPDEYNRRVVEWFRRHLAS